MNAPTIHLNGTAPEELFRKYRDAGLAIVGAVNAVVAAAPHGRDYYPQSETAYDAAQREHRSMLNQLMSMARVYENLLSHVVDTSPGGLAKMMSLADEPRKTDEVDREVAAMVDANISPGLLVVVAESVVPKLQKALASLLDCDVEADGPSISTRRTGTYCLDGKDVPVRVTVELNPDESDDSDQNEDDGEF